MAKSTVYELTSVEPPSIEDELYTDVGADEYALGDVPRAFFGLEIRTEAAGAGTLLTLNTDYQLIIPTDQTYSRLMGFNVYHRVKIINAAYQTGDLYHTYVCLGSYTSAALFNMIMDAFAQTAGRGLEYWANDDPAVYGDRVLLLQGQVIAIADYAALTEKCYCGDANNATAAAFYKTSDSGGTTRSTAGTYMVLPDTRGLSPKGVGNATVNTRTKTGPASLGAVQEDQVQGFSRRYNFYSGADANEPLDDGNYHAWMDGGHQYVGRGTTNATNTTIIGAPVTDGTNGTPRTGTNTRDSSIGTNFGITY